MKTAVVFVHGFTGGEKTWGDLIALLKGEDLPDLTLQAKVGQAADGTLTATVPVVVSGRKPVRSSDIELSVSARPELAASADASHGPVTRARHKWPVTRPVGGGSPASPMVEG